MATVVNAIDVFLNANPAPAEPAPADRELLIESSSPGGFKVATSGAITPASITFDALPLAMPGAVVAWSATGGTITTNGNRATLTSANATSDTVTVTATLTFEGVAYSRSATAQKLYDGAKGDPGTASYVDVSAPAQAFTRANSAAAFAPASITLTATPYGGSATYQWQYWTGSAWTNVSGATAATLAVASGDFTDARTYRVQATIGGTAYHDEITLVQLTGGTNGTNGVNTITGFLTNESVTLAADSAGTVASFAPAGGTFKVYDGITDKTGTAGPVTYSVASQTGCTVAITSAGAYSVSAMSTDTASATLQAVYGGVTTQKVLSLAKSKAGATGSPGTSLYVGSIYQQAASQPTTPTGGTFNFSNATLTPPAGWTVTQPTTTTTPTWVAEFTFSTSTPGATVTAGTWTAPVVDAVNGAQGTNGTSVLTLEVYFQTASAPSAPAAGSGSYTFSTDTFSNTGMTSWSRTMPASSTTPTYRSAYTFSTNTPGTAVAGGTWSAPVIVAANGAAGTNTATAYAYQRAASAPTGTPGAVTWDFATATITTPTLANGWLKTIPAGTDPLYVTTATASATTATDTIASNEWSGAVVLAQNGAAGLNTAAVTIYQRSATTAALTKPSATTTYTFATGVLTGLNNGWVQGLPAADASKPYLQACTASASATAATDDIPASEWSAPVIQVRDGADGGGRNLMQDSGFDRGTRTFPSRSGVSSVLNGADVGAAGTLYGTKSLFFDANSTEAYLYLDGDFAKVEPGKTYALSFYYKTGGQVTGSSTSWFYRDSSNTVLGSVAFPFPTLNVNSVFTRSVVEWTAPANVTSIEQRFGFLSAGGYSWMAVDCIKIEEGSKATAWTPSPEDVAADTAAAGLTADWPKIGGTGKPADNATVGAPVGTNVGSTPAATVEAGAANGTTALNAIGSAMTVTPLTTLNPVGGTNTYSTVGTRTASVSGGTAPYTYLWSITYTDVNDTGGYMDLVDADTATVTVKSYGVNTTVYGRLTCVITDSGTRVKTVSCAVIKTHGTPP